MMVDLMGGQFSKPLVANRVTHLICYKFEGESKCLTKLVCFFLGGEETFDGAFFLLRRKV